MRTNEKNERMPENGEYGTLQVWNLIRVIGWSLAVLILLMPLIAMQFTDEVDWSAGDFLLAGLILGGTGLAFELTIRRSGNNAYRAGVLVALVAAFLLFWTNAAVGFVGSGANPANVMYFMLLIIAFTGCIASGFEPKGMTTTMIATAIIQASITVFAFISGLVANDPSLAILAINGFFILMWIGAAALFRKAARSVTSIHRID